MLEIEIHTADVMAGLSELEDHVQKLPMDRVAKVTTDGVQQNFAQHGRPAWPAIKDTSHQPLIKSGRLRNSIEAVIGDKSVDIGTDVDYGGYHQHGTKNIPRRPFLEITASEEAKIEDLLSQHLES
jgi:phage gpG-like protein